ncbi:NTE family protein RssA [compost metagenome]
MKHDFFIELRNSFYLLTQYLMNLVLKKAIYFFILSFLFIVPQMNFAQEKKPKVVLVLSGGGAKGIAHIPLLQALDSLKIVPDLIVGNSMGSVVGGLYAMGYSGDSIANIALNADWDELLGGSISLTNVSVEEKSEFDRYLIGLNLAEGKPMVSSSLLNDQRLREFLSSLTYPVYNVTNFDKLSIPYRAIATDIVNGKEVILSSGSLNVAMRASMSIPGVFQPVPYEKTLLVDGGVLNNFPTDVAQNMGADIIIGSDVGGGMAPIERLNNIGTILFQTGMLASNIKNPENQKRCDILFDHIPNLTYSTSDFKKGKEIYEEGKIATEKNINMLVALAEKLKGSNQRTHELPDVKNEFVVDTIVYKGVSDANLDLVKARVAIKLHETHTTDDLIDGVDRAIGTNLFSQITYNPFVTDEGNLGVQFNGFEYSKNQVKGSLHYDTYRGVGLILNYTGRNILGAASRFLVSVDVAEQPRFRVQYQKIFGKERSWWWRSEVYGERLVQEVFVDGDLVDNMRYRSFQFDNQINKNLNSLKSYVGIGLNYQYTNLKPKNNPEFNENVYFLNSYYFNNIELNAQYLYNSMNEVYYATSGTYFQANLSRSLLHEVDFTYSDESLSPVKGDTNGFTKFGLNIEKRLPIKKKVIGIIDAAACFIFEDQLHADDVSFTEFGYAAKYFLGGNLLNPSNNSSVFAGLHDDELNLNQFMKLSLRVQTNPMDKLYLTPHFNIASVGFNDFDDYLKDAFSPDGNWQERTETSLLMSGGATVSYKTFLGPVNFDASWVNDIDKVRIFFSVGMMFNPSK